MSSKRIRISAYVVVGLFSLALFVEGVKLPGTMTRLLMMSPIFVVGLFWLFDNWLWRVGPIKKLTKRPYVAGTWCGELISMREDASGKEVEHKPIPIVLAIRQTLISLSVTLMTAESKSRSTGATVERGGDEQYSIFYQYANTPKLGVRDRSPIHHGASVIETSELFPATLHGEYWTNRRTRGTYTVQRSGKKPCASFEDGQALRTET